MQYLPASAHAKFTCLSTCNIYLPPHMQYLFTCHCTCNIYLPLRMQYLPASARRYEAGEGAGLQSSLLSLGHRISHSHTQGYTAEYNEYDLTISSYRRLCLGVAIWLFSCAFLIFFLFCLKTFFSSF